MKVTQSCPTLCNPMDYTVHGILQARILEWVAFPSPGDLPNPGIEPVSPALQADSLSTELSGKPSNLIHFKLLFSSNNFSIQSPSFISDIPVSHVLIYLSQGLCDSVHFWSIFFSFCTTSVKLYSSIFKFPNFLTFAFIYLFGCAQSQLEHTGSSIFIAA